MTAELTSGQKKREAFAIMFAGAVAYAEEKGYPVPTESECLSLTQAMTESKADEVRKKWRDRVVPAI